MINIKTNCIPTLFMFLISLAIFSCKRDHDDPRSPQLMLNEEEVITTCKISFVDVNSVQQDFIGEFQDLDGDGGNAPTIFDTLRLSASTTYHARILLLNESGAPVDTISNEIIEEATDHLFCFDISGVNLTIVRTDSDGTYQIGLDSEWTTTNASTGNVTITLKHQPGVKDGTCEPGDTDLEIQFPMIIH